MSNYLQTKLGKTNVQRFLTGVLFLSWLVLGSGGFVVASTTSSTLQIHGDRITGMLREVPLHNVLNQLQEKLDIAYVVPREELGKPISASFSGEMVSDSLSKILAPWDYALQVNQQGKVQYIFVVAQIESTEIENNTGMVSVSHSPRANFPKKIQKRELNSATSHAQVFFAESEIVSDSELVVVASPLMVESSENVRPMVLQSSQGREMSIQPSSNFMQVIPASGYPPMEILPAMKGLRMELIDR